MKPGKLKVLLIIEQCNPEWSSVPLEGYNYFQGIRQWVDVTLATHIRNREALEKLPKPPNAVYIPESALSRKYHRFIENIVAKGKINWPLYHALSYPIYEEFNRRVYQHFKSEIARGDYDIVHALTPMMPRYPVKAVKACKTTPFILGPVNGGVPFPPGFQETARQENANLNFLRAFGRFLIPGYRATYQKADRVLAGSTYTLNLIQRLFSLTDERISLFYENGIPKHFLQNSSASDHKDKIHLLFVGRLVPYKCADLVIAALGRLNASARDRLHLTIVGGGSEQQKLEQQVRDLKLEDIVHFAGWVEQKETLQYYRQADIFCFPSIREFGGAVVLEAMACGLPCIVANNGGIGEYVTEQTGFKIDPRSREYLTEQVAEKIDLLVKDENLRSRMSQKSTERAKEFVWENKATKIIEIYQEILEK
ncbi:glycosyltransferase family 4 protein [Lusitaniella coriacea LEGE 07157]|uniref:Glycosyltransferase family 4 protein n=1 Tax=Lusitaniella coriacea LEGE 07157 TaxID=945747 RepID=A0A8J7B8M9_9CYAN|nr:glycosyltransferase family 4 protein [Lusitaniella coriacea]MBE9114793.1 glycosyltransferase family 4 protein [Lusitaniella coriacea LEGE 07157]